MELQTNTTGIASEAQLVLSSDQYGRERGPFGPHTDRQRLDTSKWAMGFWRKKDKRQRRDSTGPSLIGRPYGTKAEAKGTIAPTQFSRLLITVFTILGSTSALCAFITAPMTCPK